MTQGSPPGRPAPGPRADRRALAVAVGLPLLAAGAIVVAFLVWREGLGERIAVHWDAAGRADGFGSARGYVAGLAALTVLLPLAVGLVAGFARVWVGMRRAMLAVAGWTAAFLGIVGVLTLAVQRGGTPAGLSPWALLPAAAVALVVGWAAARVPRDLTPVVLAAGRPDPALPRSPTADVPEHPIGLGGHLRVDGGTLTVRWWRSDVVRLPVEEVAQARAIDVSAFGEFGGWGLRMAPGGRRYGFLGRGSAAVEVTRADGSRWVVTTPRAELVAGAVNTGADLR